MFVDAVSDFKKKEQKILKFHEIASTTFAITA